MNLQGVNVKEEVNGDYNMVVHVYPNERMDYSVLGNEEKEILDVVVERFRVYKGIAGDMKEEVYERTSVGAVIPFSLVRESKE